MSRLTYLLDEVCAGVEIYYSGRTGGQYLKSAFVLCDDYVELTSKLYLLKTNSQWSEKRPNKTYKSFHNVVDEAIAAHKSANGGAVGDRIKQIANDSKERRGLRNQFFHGTHLLELNVSQRMCVAAFVELLELGEAFFGVEWTEEVKGARNLETLQLLLQLELRCFSDTRLSGDLRDLIASWPRNQNNMRQRTGVQVAVHPEDLHLRLCVINGAVEFRDKLVALLA